MALRYTLCLSLISLLATEAYSEVVALSTVSSVSSATLQDGDTVIVNGSRGGQFSYDRDSSATIDNGIVFDGPGSRGRLVRQWDNQVVKPEWFGAITDDRTDDAPAIQDAIDVLESLDGGELRFSPGQYDIDSRCLIYNVSGFRVIGNGAKLKAMDTLPVTSNNEVLRIETCTDFTISNLTLDGNGSVRGQGENTAMLYDCKRFAVTNCRFQDGSLDNVEVNGGTLVSTSPVATTANSSTDVFTTTDHGLADDTGIELGGTTVPGGLDRFRKYYVVSSTANTFQVSETSGGAEVDFSTNGSGVTYQQVNTNTEDGLFDNCTFTDPLRNCLSIIQGHNLTVRGGRMTNSTGSHGLDCEPNPGDTTGGLRRITAESVLFENIKKAAINYHTDAGDDPDKEMVVDRCRFLKGGTTADATSGYIVCNVRAKILNCFFRDVATSATWRGLIDLGGSTSAEEVLIQGNTFLDIGTSTRILNANTGSVGPLRVIANHFENVGQVMNTRVPTQFIANLVDNSSGSNGCYFFVQGDCNDNRFVDCTSPVARFEGTGPSSFSNNRVENSSASSIVYTYGTVHVTIHDNTFYQPSSVGYQLRIRSVNSHLKGNTFFNCAANPVNSTHGASFDVGDTTPSIYGGRDFADFNNTSPVTVTSFIGGRAGDIMTARVDDDNTTLQHTNGTLTLAGASDITPSDDLFSVTFLCDEPDEWREIARSAN